MEIPKVLIFGQPFNNFSGGGITITNLFKGWPKNKIAVLYLGHGLVNITTDVCDIYYQLGEEEHKWVFPFNRIQRKFRSGQVTFDKKKEIPGNRLQAGLRYKLVNKYFFPFLRWMGLFHIVSRITISEKLKEWLSDFQPQVLYLQVSTLEEIFFANEIIRLLKIPSVIHVMDDWPTTISNRGLFRHFWQKRIDKEFRNLLKQIDLHLSISDSMTEEYEKRYGLRFTPFHNPIEIDSWTTHIKKDFTIDKKYITVLYSGRIGDNGIAESLVEVASAIDFLNDNNQINIKLHIQSPTRNKEILESLQKHKSVVINPVAEYSQIPAIFSKADILLLANDFSKMGIDYLKLSMPTKASEYMVSGTPVLVYASEGAAVSKFFGSNECGYCVTKQSKTEIIKAFEFLIDNEFYRKKISSNAVNLAKERFNAGKVRSQFQNLLINLNKK